MEENKELREKVYEIIKRKGPVGIGRAVATVDGSKAVVCELSFAIEE